MIDVDLQRRVVRLTRGERRTADLDRLFLGLRERAYGRASVREIGDFVAHRGQREKGPVTTRVRDIFISFENWTRGLLGQVPTLDVVKRVAAANLRIVTDEQLQARLALRRKVVTSVLQQGFQKLEHGGQLTDRERLIINYLGGAFIWNQTFTDTEVLSDLVFVLLKHKLLHDDDRMAFEKIASFLTLYVLTLMHGSTVLLDGGTRAELSAGFWNDQRHLEVKAELTLGHKLIKGIPARSGL